MFINDPLKRFLVARHSPLAQYTLNVLLGPIINGLMGSFLGYITPTL